MGRRAAGVVKRTPNFDEKGARQRTQCQEGEHGTGPSPFNHGSFKLLRTPHP